MRLQARLLCVSVTGDSSRVARGKRQDERETGGIEASSLPEPHPQHPPSYIG